MSPFAGVSSIYTYVQCPPPVLAVQCGAGWLQCPGLHPSPPSGQDTAPGGFPPFSVPCPKFLQSGSCCEQGEG